MQDGIEQLETCAQTLMDSYQALKTENQRLRQQNETIRSSLRRVIEHLQLIEDEL